MSDFSKQNLPEFQYELVRVPPSEALQKFLELREEGKGVFSPVILDSPEKYYQDNDQMNAFQQELPKRLVVSLTTSVENFFSRRKEENAEYYQELEKGSWPAVPYKFDSYLLRQMEEVFIAKVPTPHSYEAIAYIGFGGWNDCPKDEEHVAVLKYWHDRYGANLFAQGGDILECTVERPPTTREEALNLAREQMLYSPGSLCEFAGCENSIQNLAAALLNSRHWLFWWD